MTSVDTPDASPLPAGLSQTDVVVQSIKAMITRGELGRGSRLPVEKDLAVALGVSRGSLREGVRALAIMGVLETRQGDGTYVTSLDSELLLAPDGVHGRPAVARAPARSARRPPRARVRGGGAGGAAHQPPTSSPRPAPSSTGSRAQVFADPVTDHETVMSADIAFHRVIAKASDNGALAALIDALADRTMLARRTIGVQHEEQVRTAFHEHEAILAALTAHEPDRARLLMSHHLLAIEDFVHEDDPLSAAAQ